MTMLWEQTWFDIVHTFYAIISKLKHCWWKNNNYIEKSVIIYIIIQVVRYYTRSSNINQ
jgi:hypothetical protein